MTKVLSLIFFLLVSASAFSQSLEERLREHVYYLASDEMKGRLAGSPDAKKVAEYIAGQYEAAGMKPLLQEWYMPFMDDYRNVVALIPGSDPDLRDEYIVLGAHYDHLGVKRNQIYNGADDNASGSAALIEIARMLSEEQSSLGRSVIIAAFDAEEEGLYGSTTLAKILRSYNVRLMMSIDMVGWLSNGGGKLIMEGTSTIKDGEAVLLEEAEKAGIELELKGFEKSIFTATDTEGFARRGIPTLAVTTGTKSPYHKPEDDADLIDYAGLAKISCFIAAVTEDISSDPTFASSGKVAPKHRPEPLLSVGVTASAGSSPLAFPNASFVSRKGLDMQAGMSFLLSSRGSLGLMVSALYQQNKYLIPTADNVYSEHFSMKRSALIVPVQLIIHTEETVGAGAFLGLGGYYGRTLSSDIPDDRWSVNPNEFGLTYTVGARLGPFVYGIQRYRQLNRFLGDSDPKARNRSLVFTLTYLF